MTLQENYISVDVESSGAVPGLHAMLELGACQVSDISNTFSASLEMLPSATWSKETWDFWQRTEFNRKALDAILAEARPIYDVMREFRTWLAQWQRPIIVAWPVTFDFAFVNFYWWYVFKCEPPFGWGGLDIKTLAMVKMRSKFRGTNKRQLSKRMPQMFDRTLKHTHRGLDDAREQAVLFRNLIESL